MRESQCAFQWGLQVVVRIDSLFRVQTKQQRQIDDSIEGPVVSTTLQHCLFLPKSKYSALADNNHDNSVSSTTSVYLMQQQQRQTTSQSETPKSSSTETDTDEPRTISKSSSSASQADSSFAGYTHEFPTRELPELLKIYIRGGFSDEVPSANSSPNQQHQEFVRLTIQTVHSSPTSIGLVNLGLDLTKQYTSLIMMAAISPHPNHPSRLQPLPRSTAQ